MTHAKELIQMCNAALHVLKVRLKEKSSCLRRRNERSNTTGAKNVLQTVPQTQTHPHHKHKNFKGFCSVVYSLSKKTA